MEPVKGSPQISLKNAALRQSRPHRVSFLSSASYTPTSLDGVSLDSRVASLPYESSSLAHPAPLRGPLLHGKASHVVFRSLTLPYKPRSLATLKGTQDVTGLPSCCINRTVLSAELATSGGFSPFGALRHHLPPAERWDNKEPQSNPFISRTTISTGCSATACGGSPAKRARGMLFPRPPGRLYGFRRQRRHKKWRPKGRPPRQRSGAI